MSVFDHVLLPWGMVCLAIVAGTIADRGARRRRRDSGGDRGDFWAAVVGRVCLFLSIPALLSAFAPIVPPLWKSGWHLQFDLTGVAGLSLASSYRLALLLPFVVWAALLLCGVAEKPGGREAGRWLAGGIDFAGSRAWVLIWGIPLALLLISSVSDLGGGASAYPAAVWGTVAVLLVSLAGVACSAGTSAPAVDVETTPAEVVAPSPVRPWPEALQSRGIVVRPVVSWPKTGATRAVEPPAEFLSVRLQQLGAKAIAPELLESLQALLGDAADADENARLVFAPDNCGQVEVVALGADMIHHRSGVGTLVITAGDPALIAAELRRWLPAHCRVVAVEAAGEIELDAVVVVTDAQTLSDSLLPKFKNPALLKRFGLIVWWQVDAYSGVLAANLWAISRRLHRLVTTGGRGGVRTLAFARSAAVGDAQLGAFIRRLLPHPFAASAEVTVEPRFPHAVHLHVIESHQAYFDSGDGANIDQRNRHLPLVAARVSAEEGWSTYLDVPADIDDSEAGAFLRLTAGDRMLKQRLVAHSTLADARVRKVESGDVLSLVEMVSQGGRASDDDLPHHVGITLPPNPYVEHLLSTLQRTGGRFPAARRLVSATAQREVMRRHLLLALEELPDTWTGLRNHFLWDAALIRDTLDEIAHDGELTRDEVRFLDDLNELRRDHEYKSLRAPSGERRPLDTVGSKLVDVRDAGGTRERDGGVRMRVDPERLTIQAYPYRVFVKHGQRYRIQNWERIEDAVAAGWVGCEREDLYSATSRMHHTTLFSITTDQAPIAFGRQARSFTRQTATLYYQDSIYGVLRFVPNLTTGVTPPPVRQQFARPISQSFLTRALLIRFPGQPEAIALASVAQALRHVLPVHLGVDEDALDVVPLINEPVHGRQLFGFAIVDLYPGGIGLVDEVSDDGALLLQFLERSGEWLAACRCKNDKGKSEQGCEHCVRSPAAVAANELPLARGAALRLLENLV